MNVKFEIGENKVVIQLEGELDHHNVRNLKDEIDSVLNRVKPKLTVFDFTKVPFCDSSGIAIVLGRYRLMNTMGGKIEIINVNSHIKRLLCLGGVSRFVTIR